MNEALRNRLDPRGLMVLKKRLASGDITPQAFKDILRRQMVKQYFNTQRSALTLPWKRWRRLDRNDFDSGKNTGTRSGKNSLETVHHKRFR